MGILPAIVLEATAHPRPQLSLQDRHGVQSTPGLPLSSVTPRLQISAATTLGGPALSCQGCSDPAGVGAPGQRCDVVRKFSGQRGPQSLFLNCTPLLLLESPCAGPNASSPCCLCRADVCGPVIAAPSLGVQFGRVPKMLLGPRFLRNRRLLPLYGGAALCMVAHRARLHTHSGIRPRPHIHTPDTHHVGHVPSPVSAAWHMLLCLRVCLPPKNTGDWSPPAGTLSGKPAFKAMIHSGA